MDNNITEFDNNNSTNIFTSFDEIINSIEYEIMRQPFENEIINNNNNTINQTIITSTLGKYVKCKDDDILNECIICTDAYKLNEGKRILPCCKNQFHKKCIDKWFKHHSFTCPMCRNNFNEKDKIFDETHLLTLRNLLTIIIDYTRNS